MAEGIKKWINAPVLDTMNMKTAPIGDLIAGIGQRLQTVATERVQAFMDGQAEKTPSDVFYTDLRTAINALRTLRKHF